MMLVHKPQIIHKDTIHGLKKCGALDITTKYDGYLTNVTDTSLYSEGLGGLRTRKCFLKIKNDASKVFITESF